MCQRRGDRDIIQVVFHYYLRSKEADGESEKATDIPSSDSSETLQSQMERPVAMNSIQSPTWVTGNQMLALLPAVFQGIVTEVELPGLKSALYYGILASHAH